MLMIHHLPYETGTGHRYGRHRHVDEGTESGPRDAKRHDCSLCGAQLQQDAPDSAGDVEERFPRQLPQEVSSAR